jgi:monofunctional biosynthetic peptidoglycan transglycosylase
MAEAAKKPRKKPQARKPTSGPAELPTWGGLARRGLRLLGRAAFYATAAFLALVLVYAFVNPRLTPYVLAERFRQGGIERTWVRIGDMAPGVAAAVVAAEDANFCQHWGFDMKAIRAAIDEGAGRGASTISQQVTKNVFLWQGRSWPRKALEGLMTPVVELVWTKRRILEVYLNVAETGPGLFGIEAAAQHYFGVGAADLSPGQAARIAAILPDPKGRNPASGSGYIRKRAAQIRSGAETIAADGRAACFED